MHDSYDCTGSKNVKHLKVRSSESFKPSISCLVKKEPADHGFLHQVQASLFNSAPLYDGPPVGYVHFQSGFENSLFGWQSGHDECDYGVQDYFALNMEQYW